MIDGEAPSKFSFWWFLLGIVAMVVAFYFALMAFYKTFRFDQYDANGNLVASSKAKFFFQWHRGTSLINPNPAAQPPTVTPAGAATSTAAPAATT